MPYQFLTEERLENLAIVSLNRPDKRNALSIALREEIYACFASLARDDAVSVAVLLTNGPVYCAGFDLTEFGQSDPALMERFNTSSIQYHETLAEFPKPIVTGIQGPAMGGGFDLAALCDVRIATNAAKFAHPEIKFGAPTLYGPLNAAIPGGMARDLAFTGRAIDAETALRYGFISRIVEPEALRDETIATARTIAEAPLTALLNVKQQIIDTYGGKRILGSGNAFTFAGIHA